MSTKKLKRNEITGCLDAAQALLIRIASGIHENGSEFTKREIQQTAKLYLAAFPLTPEAMKYLERTHNEQRKATSEGVL